MSNVEHIFENTICKFERGTYDNMDLYDILEDIRNDSNYGFINDLQNGTIYLDAEDICTMAIYATTTYKLSVEGKFCKKLRDAGVDLKPWLKHFTE